MNVKVVPLPYGVNGFVSENCGEYTVLLNSRCTFEQNRKTYLHEMEHIQNNDMYGVDTADSIESRRHKK